MGLSSAVLGVEQTDLPVYYWRQLEKLAPQAQLMDGSGVFTFARAVKTPMEVELYRAAAYCTVKAIHVAFAAAKPGDTEKQIASNMQAHVLALGADHLDFLHLHTGVHSTVVHSWPLEIPTRPGDIIHVDFGAVFGGYRTDIGRTAVVEASNEKQERIYRQLRDVEQFMIENMRPGVVGGELYARAQSVFGKTGLVYPWGTMGHSIGCCVMEDGFEIADGLRTRSLSQTRALRCFRITCQ
jgi:Xaa-Pro aminopeptidase